MSPALIKRTDERLEEILGRALEDRELGPRDIAFLLDTTDERSLSSLYEAARQARRRHFGADVFLYGFTFFSTHCRNDCIFCHYRASHRDLPRYRKKPEEVLAAAFTLARDGVHLLDLTMGEDPLFYENGGQGFQLLTGMIQEVKRAVGLPIMVSPGAVPDEVLGDLAAAGADWYACYQETHNRVLFDHLRPRRNYDERWRKKITAQAAGLLVEEGILSGVGDSLADVAESIECMKRLDADQVRVMSFVPQEGTPLAGTRKPDVRRELIAIAVLRLVFPDRLIPASLDVDGLAGLKMRLEAGANVVTSLVPPGRGWSGVAHSHLDIEEARRTPAAVRPILEACQLQPAQPDDYVDWMNRRRLGSNRPAGQGEDGRRMRPEP
ncbi:MAG: methylornithine synthase PylB [Thermodesulfobacteriota bacterium]